MEQQTLPEDIREKIEADIYHWRLLEEQHAYREGAAFGYHLRDSEVEWLKQLIKSLEGKHSSANTLITQQAATIKELLEAGNRLMRHSNESPATSEYKDFYSAYDDFKQLLNKHKP